MAVNSKGVFTKKIKFDHIERREWGVAFYYKEKHIATINNIDGVIYL